MITDADIEKYWGTHSLCKGKYVLVDVPVIKSHKACIIDFASRKGYELASESFLQFVFKRAD